MLTEKNKIILVNGVKCEQLEYFKKIINHDDVILRLLCILVSERYALF